MDYLNIIAKQIRRECLQIAFNVRPRASHLGGALSSVDIITVLFFSIMKYKQGEPTWSERDRFFLSKGHSVLGYYAILCKAGFFSSDILSTYGANGTSLPGHPVINKKMGIEFTNGSLGMGLSVAIGHAIAAKKRKKNYKTFVLMGDGECNEGSVWEAVIAASHFKLDNLILIIDKNGLQQTGNVDDVMNMDNMFLRFLSFGWEAIEVNGHDVNELHKSINKDPSEKPKVIIANTIKGKGFSFTEGNNSWHHGVMTKDNYLAGLKELDEMN